MDFYNKFDDKYEINVYLRTAIIVNVIKLRQFLNL